mgnify:CR=1 FL=1|jgi:hypothetical protein
MSQKYSGHRTRKMNRKHMRFNQKGTLKHRGRQYVPTIQRRRDVEKDRILAKKMAKDIEYKANNPGLGLSFTDNVKKLYKMAQTSDNIAAHYLRQGNRAMWLKFKTLALGYRVTAITLILAYNPKAPPDIMNKGGFPLTTIKAPGADHEILVKWHHPITKPRRANKPVYTRKERRQMNKMARKTGKRYNN